MNGVVLGALIDVVEITEPRESRGANESNRCEQTKGEGYEQRLSTVARS